MWDDYDYEVENRDIDLNIIWECINCHNTKSDKYEYNEGGYCECGGIFRLAEESYNI